jgi:hypothetical protein
MINPERAIEAPIDWYSANLAIERNWTERHDSFEWLLQQGNHLVQVAWKGEDASFDPDRTKARSYAQPNTFDSPIRMFKAQD